MIRTARRAAQLVSLGPQPVIVLVDARDLRLQLIQAPGLGAEPLVLLDQGADEVVYPNGKYVLYGDGVNEPYQWVWIPAPPPPPTQ